MFFFNPSKLCRIRSTDYFNTFRQFNRNSKKSKWTSSLLSKKSVKVTEVPSSISDVGISKLFKPFVFTVSFSGCCFVSASIWQYEEMRKKANNLFQSTWLDRAYSPSYKRGEIRRQINSWWHSQSEGQKIAFVIIGINVCVFLLWRVPQLHPFMRKYFSASPAMNATCLPMILSVFSHYSFIHLFANMYVLYSFSSTAVEFFGKEQFLALYGSAGVVSSFASYVHKVLRRKSVTSLGASGALMTVLSTICFQFPNAQVGIFLLPFFSFSAGSAIKAIMALDLVGILAKWKLFDHAAHLGGAIFGIFYLYHGHDYLWGKREFIFTWYHKLRERNS